MELTQEEKKHLIEAMEIVNKSFNQAQAAIEVHISRILNEIVYPANIKSLFEEKANENRADLAIKKEQLQRLEMFILTLPTTD